MYVYIDLFLDSPPFQSYDAFLLMSLLLLWMLIFIKETIRFNMVYELSSLFATEERSAVRCIFNRQFRGLLFESCSDRVVGTCQTCYRYYCPSLLTVLQLYVIPRTLSTESASNDYSNRKRHHCRNHVTRKRRRIWKKKYLHLLLKMISPAISIVLEFSITLYIV
jgi:hypothetical protein